MRNAFDLKLEELLEFLEDLGLNNEQVVAAEMYFENGDKDALKNMPSIDLSKINVQETQKFNKIYRHFKNKGREQEYAKYFQLFFAIGGCTMADLLPMYEFACIDITKDYFAQTLDPAILISVYAEVKTHYYIHNTDFVNNIIKLMKLSKEPLDILLEKIDFYHKGHCKCRVMLPIYCSYFKLKEEDSFDKKTNPFLESYEECIIAGLKSICSKKADLNVFKDFVKTKHESASLSPSISTLVKRCHMNENSFIFRVGCAYLNRTISPIFYNFVNICLNVDLFASLNIIDRFEFLSTRYMKPNEQESLINHFDSFVKILEEFSVDIPKALQWCAENHTRTTCRNYTLEYCVKKYKEEYIKALESAKPGIYATMFCALKEVDPEQAEEILKEDQERLKKQYIETICTSDKKAPFYQDLCQFISGEKGVDVLYLHEKEIFDHSIYVYGDSSKAFDDYIAIFGADDKMKRILTYYCFAGNSGNSCYSFNNVFRRMCTNGSYELDANKVKNFFEDIDNIGLAILYQLNGMGKCYDERGNEKGMLQCLTPILASYLEIRKEETLKAFQDANVFGRMIGITVLGKSPKDYREELLNAFSDPSKVVRECLVEIILENQDFREDVIKKLSSKKASEREVAVRVLSKWNKEEDKRTLELALEKEKSSKVSTLISEALGMKMEEEKEEKGLTLNDFVKNMIKGNKKRTLAWAFETPFPIVHDKEGKEVDNNYMMALLLCYSDMVMPGINKDAPVLAEKLNSQELALFMKELFDRWIKRGAEAKKKWVLYASSIHGGIEIVANFQHYINEWPKASRGAIAAEAVKALALNTSPSALLVVDSISRKFKFRQVKNAAGEALEFAAKQLGITKEELADKIVPDLGFNENMERIFDYGERQFKVYINQALEIEVYDGNNKKLKNLPAPGKKDDEAKAAEAYAEFKMMKKQMKTTVATQKMRLELALSSERKWKCDDWKKLFIQNPIMHQFAISLIWGIYKEGKLTDTFRYMEDGTFNTAEEEEYRLEEDCFIGLVHPIELTSEQRKEWQEQLEDYEITQSIEQLERKVYELTKEELTAKYLERFGGKVVNDLSLNGKLSAIGWYRGSVLDAGGFYEYYREDPTVGLGVELHFSGAYVGGENEDVTVYHAIFYKIKCGNDNNAWAVERGSYVYDKIKEQAIVSLVDVPKRYFSEIVYQLEKATASATGTDPNWKNNAYENR